MVLLKYAASVCQIDGLVVNCLDHLEPTTRICTSYAESNSIEIPHTLKEQTQLTKTLESVVPVIRRTTVDGILETLSEIAPVVITAVGPTHLDRTGTSDSNLVTASIGIASL